MKKHSFTLFLLLAIVLLLPFEVSAHPGRTDSSGCHTCRTNCGSWGLSSGEYHCHQSKGVTQPLEPIRSHYGEGGTGTTESWPEYQKPKTITPEPVKAVNEAPKVEKPAPVQPTTNDVKPVAKPQLIKRTAEEKKQVVPATTLPVTLPAQFTEIPKPNEGIWSRFWRSMAKMF